ncbi:MAG TPA: tetratricopeptide repeat protein [Pyrinomonadaceae bacterium]|jgi:tetratricopeptide (TPR) repeat protein
MKLLFCPLILIFAFSGSVFAQTGKGIELYNQGDYESAIKILEKAIDENRNDVTAFYYLGLNQEKLYQPKKAAEYYARAVDGWIKLAEATIEAELGKASLEFPRESMAFYVRNKLPGELQTAVESARKFEQLNSKKASAKDWKIKILTLKFFSEPSESQKKTADKKLNGKSIADSTRAANEKPKVGIIRFWILFLSNGEVGMVVPIKRLSETLTEQAFQMARKIKFEPKIENGKAVSTAKIVEYTVETTN